MNTNDRKFMVDELGDIKPDNEGQSNLKDLTASLRNEETTPHRQQLRLLLEFDVVPRPGQSPEDAVDEMREVVTEYLTDNGRPFFEDYGVYEADLADDDTASSWGGYEGPFVTRVVISENGVITATSDW